MHPSGCLSQPPSFSLAPSLSLSFHSLPMMILFSLFITFVTSVYIDKCHNWFHILYIHEAKKHILDTKILLSQLLWNGSQSVLVSTYKHLQQMDPLNEIPNLCTILWHFCINSVSGVFTLKNEKVHFKHVDDALFNLKRLLLAVNYRGRS